jgi:hypothetical protein
MTKRQDTLLLAMLAGAASAHTRYAALPSAN